MTGWNVVVSDFRCPHKYSEMKDSKWFEACDLIRKKCNIDNCRKKVTLYTNGLIKEFLADLKSKAKEINYTSQDAIYGNIMDDVIEKWEKRIKE